MGESLGAVGSAVAQRSAVEGFEFKVAQTVEGEHSEDTECANAEVAGECGDGARAEVVDQVGDAHAAEEGEREEAGGRSSMQREDSAEERPTPRAGGAGGEVTQRKIAGEEGEGGAAEDGFVENVRAAREEEKGTAQRDVADEEHDGDRGRIAGAAE